MAHRALIMKILSPTGVIFEGEILHAVFPGTIGEFAVFPAHAPLISSLRKGRIGYTMPNEELRECVVSGGFVEVYNDTITVCIEQ